MPAAQMSTLCMHIGSITSVTGKWSLVAAAAAAAVGVGGVHKACQRSKC